MLDGAMILPRKPSVEPAFNAGVLRTAGIAHLQRLSGKIWTDYNVHDPGITILDVLCFALTDLSYRTNHRIEDILAKPEGAEDTGPPFFTAAEILTCNPVTLRDFRKLIIDCDGVRNAWLEPTDGGEVPIFWDSETRALSYLGAPDQQLHLRGLYDVFVELDMDPELGDLNDATVDWRLAIERESNGSTVTETLLVEAEFLEWRDPPDADQAVAIGDADWSEGTLEWDLVDRLGDLEVAGFTVEPKPDRALTLTALLRYPEDGGPHELQLSIELRSSAGARDLQPLQSEIEAALQVDSNACFLEIIQEYLKKVERRRAVVKAVIGKLRSHRNLCEDYLSVRGMRIEEIAVCADLELTPEADVDAVLAEVLYQIELFLSPDIRFQWLEDLLDAGVSPADIFNGPRLDHGFIDDGDLDKPIRREVVNVSDLINILIDIDGVIAVRDILLTSYVEGEVRHEGVRWELRLSQDKWRVPRFADGKSRFQFFKGLIPHIADRDNVALLLEEKRAQARRPKLAEGNYDLEIPEGVDRDLAGYTSIQNHFPLTYGVGPVGLGPEADEARHAKAKQLKAFLMFFDQLLADYMAQLSQVRNLLSVNAELAHTRFTQALYDAPDVRVLLTDFVGGLPPETDIEDEAAIDSHWQSYLLDPEATGYRKQIQALAEDDETFSERRNALLDHLLARFAEQFSDYAVLLYDLRGGKQRAAQELITDKLAFLRSYAETSYRRGAGFDTKAGDRQWNADNVTGLERRVGHLLGIPVMRRRSLANVFVRHFQWFPDAGQWRIRVALTDGTEVLAGTDSFATEAAALAALETIKQRCVEEASYETETSGAQLHLVLTDETGGQIATGSELFDTEANLARRRGQIVEVLRWAADDNPVEAHFQWWESASGGWRYRLSLPEAGFQFQSPKAYDTEVEAIVVIEQVVALGNRAEHYEVHPTEAGNFTLRIKAGDGENLAVSSKSFTTEQEALEAVRAAADLVEAAFYREGFHIVEHILLRPRTTGSPLFPMALAEDCEPALVQLDPYTCRLSVILPFAPERFQNMPLRLHIEETLRLEAPAHVSLKICWINGEQMRAFEAAYRAWLYESAEERPDPDARDAKLADLLAIMNDLRNVFPKATLFDCRDEDAGRPVVLGHTSLGTFSETEGD